jgi:hypothetical protein
MSHATKSLFLAKISPSNAIVMIMISMLFIVLLFIQPLEHLQQQGLTGPCISGIKTVNRS